MSNLVPGRKILRYLLLTVVVSVLNFNQVEILGRCFPKLSFEINEDNITKVKLHANIFLSVLDLHIRNQSMWNFNNSKISFENYKVNEKILNDTQASDKIVPAQIGKLVLKLENKEITVIVGYKVITNKNYQNKYKGEYPNETTITFKIGNNEPVSYQYTYSHDNHDKEIETMLWNVSYKLLTRLLDLEEKKNYFKEYCDQNTDLFPIKITDGEFIFDESEIISSSHVDSVVDFLKMNKNNLLYYILNHDNSSLQTHNTLDLLLEKSSKLEDRKIFGHLFNTGERKENPSHFNNIRFVSPGIIVTFQKYEDYSSFSYLNGKEMISRIFKVDHENKNSIFNSLTNEMSLKINNRITPKELCYLLNSVFFKILKNSSIKDGSLEIGDFKTSLVDRSIKETQHITTYRIDLNQIDIRFDSFFIKSSQRYLYWHMSKVTITIIWTDTDYIVDFFHTGFSYIYRLPFFCENAETNCKTTEAKHDYFYEAVKKFSVDFSKKFFGFILKYYPALKLNNKTNEVSALLGTDFGIETKFDRIIDLSLDSIKNILLLIFKNRGFSEVIGVKPTEIEKTEEDHVNGKKSFKFKIEESDLSNNKPTLKDNFYQSHFNSEKTEGFLVLYKEPDYIIVQFKIKPGHPNSIYIKFHNSKISNEYTISIYGIRFLDTIFKEIVEKVISFHEIKPIHQSREIFDIHDIQKHINQRLSICKQSNEDDIYTLFNSSNVIEVFNESNNSSMSLKNSISTVDSSNYLESEKYIDLPAIGQSEHKSFSDNKEPIYPCKGETSIYEVDMSNGKRVRLTHKPERDPANEGHWSEMKNLELELDDSRVPELIANWVK